MRTSTLLSFVLLCFAAVNARAQCDPALIVPPDGTAIPNDIVISEINPGPGGYIELYNRTGNIVSLNGWWFCSPFLYSPLGATSIGAYSYKTYAWPAGFGDDDTQGEIMLYDSASFANSNDIIDYVPWGASNLFRFGQADAVNKWSGDAAPALVNGAIHRKTNTTGTSAADYDVELAPSPQNCAGLPTGIGDAPSHPAITLAISPNPFSSLATISFDLSSTAEVSGAVYSVTGERVRTLEKSVRHAGAGRLFWDGRDDAGNEVPSGTYLLKVSANSAVATQRVTVLR